MKNRRRKKGSSALSFSLYILAVILFTVFLRYFVIERVVVVGESMEPTLDNRDNVLIDKLSARAGEIDRYDIVVFPADGVFLIKRVYGLPGETVRIDETGVIYINDKPIDDRYAYQITKDPGRASGAGVTLLPDEYFVLGDNRNNSVDSRYPEVGNIRDKDIRGRVILRLTPLGKFGKIK